MSNESKVREAFEQHALSLYGGNDDAWLEWCPAGPCVRTPIQGGSIDDRFVSNEWAAWQASRAAALEEAAEALRLLRPNSEGYKRSEWDKFDWEQPCADAIDTAFDIGAAAIRALAAKEGL